MLNKHNHLLHTVEAHCEDVWETVKLSGCGKRSFFSLRWLGICGCNAWWFWFIQKYDIIWPYFSQSCGFHGILPAFPVPTDHHHISHSRWHFFGYPFLILAGLKAPNGSLLVDCISNLLSCVSSSCPICLLGRWLLPRWYNYHPYFIILLQLFTANICKYLQIELPK